MHRGQARTANKIIEQIKTSGPIHEYDLIDLLNISVASYEKIRPWILHRYGDTVDFDKKTRQWRYLVVENI